MSEVIEKESTELIESISAELAPTIYGHSKLDAFYDRVASEVKTEVPDLSTKKGRDRIASLSAKVSRSKTAVEKPGRDYLKKIKELPKTIEVELREFCQKMDALRDEVRQPLTEWEKAEAQRVANHEMAIQEIKLRIECRDLNIDETRRNIQWLTGLVINESWEEYEAEAHRVKESALIQLNVHLEDCEQREAEQAELARLRAEAAAREQKEREERIAREAEERARREAEAAAQAERDAVAKREADAKAAAERRELELKLQAEKAEREKQEAINRAAQEKAAAEERQKQAVEAERKRQADEIARQEAEAKAREADRKHKQAILGAAKDAIIETGVTNDQAVKIVKLIAAGGVPNVRISY